MSYAALPESQIKEDSYSIIFLNILFLAGPIALTFAINGLAVAVGAMSGQLSGNREQNLAAGNLIMSMLMTLLAIGISPMIAVNIFSTGRVGQIDEREKNKSVLITPEAKAAADAEINKLKKEISGVWQAGIFVTAPFLPIPVAAMYFSEWTLRYVFGQDPQIAALAQNFLRPYAIIPVIYGLIRMPGDQLLFALRRPNIAMGFALSCFGIGVGIACLLAYGKSNVSAMGFSGIAYGFIIETALTSLLLAAYLNFSKSTKDYRFFQNLFVNPFTLANKARIKELLRSAIPLEINMASQLAAPLALNSLAGRYSIRALAVQSYSAWLIFFLIIFQLSLGYAVAQETNRSRGIAKAQTEAQGLTDNRAYRNTAKTAWGGIAGATLFMLPLCVLAMAYPRLIIDMVSSLNAGDSDDTASIMTAQNAIQITAAGILLDTIGNTTLQISRALGDNNIPAGISIGSLWLGVLMSYVLANHTSLGILGFPTGYTIGNALGIAPLGYRLAQRTKLNALAFTPQVRTITLEDAAIIEASDQERLLSNSVNC